jgi:hypothetical protein
MSERISFTRSLYLPEAVEAAAEAHRDLAKIQVNLGNDEIELVIDEPDPDVADVLCDEVANYVLAETVRRLRSGQ